MATTEVIEKLEQQLTCSVCLDQYENPRILPCFHSFCLDCLRGIPLEYAERGERYIPCPTCRTPSLLPVHGVDGFPPSFIINNLVEFYNSLKKASGDRKSHCDTCENPEAVRFCNECKQFLCKDCLRQHDRWTNGHHTVSVKEAVGLGQTETPNCADHNQPLDTFCEKCVQLLCQHCFATMHRGHEHNGVNEAYAKHMPIMHSSLHPINLQIDRVNEAITMLGKRKLEISDQGKRTKELARQVILQMKEILDQTERQMNEDIDSAIKHKLEITEHQAKEAEGILDQLTECRYHIQQSMKISSPHQFLAKTSQTSTQMEFLLKRKNLVPLELPDIRLVRDVHKNIEDITQYIGKIQTTVIAKSVNVSADYQHIPMVGEECNLSMSLALANGSPVPIPPTLITCDLTPPSSVTPIQCTVMKTDTPGQYSVKFTPFSKGLHQMHVKIQEEIIAGSPIILPVSVPAKMRNELIKTLDMGYNGPMGVAASHDGYVIVSECHGHCITVATKDGLKVRSFGHHGSGKGQLIYPRGIGISAKDTVLVADSGNHCIQEFAINGVCLSRVGSEGDGPLKFNFPIGIAVNDSTGSIYITEKWNRRIHVLNSDLSFAHMFGGPIDAPFSDPSGVAVDSQGYVYVTDQGSETVSKFTHEGRFVASFGNKSDGANSVQVTRPMGVAVDKNDLLFIAEGYPHCQISVFTTTGDFVYSFGKGVLTYPCGLSFDSSNQLLVCDREKKDVKIF